MKNMDRRVSVLAFVGNTEFNSLNEVHKAITEFEDLKKEIDSNIETLKKISVEMKKEEICEKERKIYNFLHRNRDYPITFHLTSENVYLSPGSYQIKKVGDRWIMAFNEKTEVYLSSLKNLKVIFDV